MTNKKNSKDYNVIINVLVHNLVHHIPPPFSCVKLGVTQHEREHQHYYLLAQLGEPLEIGKAAEPSST